MTCWHYPIPTGGGRWAAATSVPGSNAWTVVVDCPSEEAAREECERLNARIVPVPRLACDWLDEPQGVQ